MLAYYYDHINEPATFASFGAGEIAILPASSIGGQVSKCYLMACPDTHLLEINAVNTKVIYELFPETERLAKLILAYQWKKYQERDQLLRYEGKDRVKQFYEIFPLVEGSDKRNSLVRE